ncbi:MAG: helix-turn-helix transcriptional regulator [Candidatus Paceibacterota bacterium]|nr:helix-turn-helix transcriptional regulator [Candidatus Paceibacterota bacterium]MDD4830567.1 helix-turn-helix transcriptional regulator [Candidatus Paceibacterota bacterium]MDD4874943.1 helix-turn-helix transcriptional regulator [Candidatus Paceibacterota bacterium]
MKNKKMQKEDSFQKYLASQLKDPEFKKYYDEYGKQLEISYQILKLRKKKGISQAELAKKIGTKQSNIARIEAGKQNFSINTLEKIAKVFDRSLKIDFI